MLINHKILALLSNDAYLAALADFEKFNHKPPPDSQIDSTVDEAAELGISDEKLRSQFTELIQAFRNAQEVISMLQAADSALHEILLSLHRMRDLAIQAAANDALTSQDREYIQTEIDKLKGEIDRMAGTGEKYSVNDGNSKDRRPAAVLLFDNEFSDDS